MLKKLGIGIVAVFALAGVGSVLGGSSTESTDASVAVDAGSGSDQSAPVVTVPTTEAPAAAPSDSGFTVSQENAIEMALDYLDTLAFSEQGLIDQLKYEGFTQAEAKFAIENIEVDWFQEAVESAQSYLDSMSFSRSGLIDQLLYEGFTEEQATYAVDEVGL